MGHKSISHTVALDWLFGHSDQRKREWKHLLRLFNIFFCTHFIDFFTIRFESGAPCEDEAKRRLWRKALRWRTRGHVWWRVTRGWANLFKFGEFRWKERSGKSCWKQLAIRFKIRNRIISSESTEECSNCFRKQLARGEIPKTNW